MPTAGSSDSYAWISVDDASDSVAKLDRVAREVAATDWKLITSAKAIENWNRTSLQRDLRIRAKLPGYLDKTAVIGVILPLGSSLANARETADRDANTEPGDHMPKLENHFKSINYMWIMNQEWFDFTIPSD